MKIKDYAIIALISILTIILSHQTNTIAAGSFANVIPMDAQGGIRFFDASTGMIYTYDASLQQVIRVVQIEELGKPGKEIVTPPSEPDLQYNTPRKD